MISVEEALRILKHNIPAPSTENVKLEDALNRRLASDLKAPESSPRYSNSAMDGIAVRWQDVCEVSSDNPRELKLIGESQAGIPFDGVVENGQAVRISTGAAIPTGTDSVIRIEDVAESPETVTIQRTEFEGQHVRYGGEEFSEGSLLLSKGLQLKAKDIALLAAVGLSELLVYCIPKVALLVTGTELRHHSDKDIEWFQARDSNAPMLKASIIENGGDCVSFAHVKDDLNATVQAISETQKGGTDIILCSGGVSVGKHDHVKSAAEKAGFTELFWKIKQKPGKPLFVAKKDNTLLFGLPGNPVSAFMCFHNYTVPALLALQGVEHCHKSISCEVAMEIANPGGRTMFTRVMIEKGENMVPKIEPISQQGSHMLSSIVKADGFVVLEPKQVLSTGDITTVYIF